MKPPTRTVWFASVALGWIVTVFIAHVLNNAVGGFVFLGGVAGLVLARVTPRLPGLLGATAAWIERRGRRWRYARTEFAQAVAWPIWLRFLWYVAALMLGVSCVLAIMDPDGILGQVLAPTSWTFLVTIASIDLINLLSVSLRRTRGKVIVVAMMSVGTAVVAAIALSFARKLLFTLTGEDPGAFPAALTLFTALLVPIGWLALLAAISAALMLPMIPATLLQMGNTQRIDREGNFHTFLVSLRPILVCAVPLLLVVRVWDWKNQEWPTAKRLATTVVVALDYWERPVCGGGRGLANRVDDDHYSVVESGRNLKLRLRGVACVKTSTGD